MATVGVAVAGPFGIEQGDDESQLEIVEQDDAGFKFQITPPKPHPRFPHYGVRLHPRTGVCQLFAIGVDIDTNMYGMQVRSEFETIQRQIDQNYGQHLMTDLLLPDSIFADASLWMMSVMQKDRLFYASWSKESSANLIDGIEKIILSVDVRTPTNGYLRLQYNFSNKEECDELINKEAAKTF